MCKVTKDVSHVLKRFAKSFERFKSFFITVKNLLSAHSVKKFPFKLSLMFIFKFFDIPRDTVVKVILP